MHINWYYVSLALTFISVWFFAKGMLTDDTPPWQHRHYYCYMMPVLVGVLEMGIIVYLSRGGK